MASRKGRDDLTAEQERTFLKILATGAVHQAQAARCVGVSSQAISNRKRRSVAFLQAFEKAEAAGEHELAKRVLEAAGTDRKPGDWKAAAWFLERRYPERWAKPADRVALGNTNLDPQEVVNGLFALLQGVAKKHAPLDEPDVDAEPPEQAPPPATA